MQWIYFVGMDGNGIKLSVDKHSDTVTGKKSGNRVAEKGNRL